MPSRAAGKPRKNPRGSVRAAGSRARTRARPAPPAGNTKARAARAVRLSLKPAPTRTPRSAVRPSPKARPLTRREVEEFRKILEVERQRLAEELERIEEHLPEVEPVSADAAGGYDEDLADVASDAFEREKGIAIENSVQELLDQVEEALGRIEEGTFGTCEVCGQPISIERLRAIPYARLCIDCKAREEQAIPR
ncbi:MAG: TraR/DksA C4-type zinc finger protein [Armatimonadota bacterium]|nr:TraR/DksA C4-type zinc finger protein [Armatimonadota bacterium]